MENIRTYIADGSFESRMPELLSKWQGNAERKKQKVNHDD
jgi:hypothetical protein